MVASNLLLNLMPEEICRELYDVGAEMRLHSGDVVSSAWLDGSYVFIVTAGIASKFQRSSIGRISEVGMVGREGLFPVSALLMVHSAPHIVLSQVGELHLLKLRTKDFHRIIAESEEAQRLFRTYIYAFITQIATNLLSSEQNDVGVRTARWLLMCHDRVDGDVIEVTHEALAQITFAYRPTITRTLSTMVEAGLIEGARGRITILSRDGLKEMAEGSYGLAEQYWRAHIGPFGKEFLAEQQQQPCSGPAFQAEAAPEFIAEARKMAPRA